MICREFDKTDRFVELTCHRNVVVLITREPSTLDAARGSRYNKFCECLLDAFHVAAIKVLRKLIDMEAIGMGAWHDVRTQHIRDASDTGLWCANLAWSRPI